MKKSTLGFILMIVAIILIFVSTKTFVIGEIICDLGGLILFALGISMIDSNKKLPYL